MSMTITETTSISDGTFLGAPSRGDGAALTITMTAPGTTINRSVISGCGAEWGLKLPNNLGSQFNNCSIWGGTERALDIVRGGDLTFRSCRFQSGADRKAIATRFSLRKQCDIGIKGGARFITFINCEINDLLLGDYSIYDHDETLAPVQGITLIDCYNPNGGPIIIRCLNAVRPTLLNTDAVGIMVPKPAVKAYFAYCRRYGDTRVGK